MLEFLKSDNDAIAILKDDHNRVKDLFDQFEEAENGREKRKIAGQVIKELKIHAAIEEEIFYPTVRRDVEKDVMREADEEHHVAKLLIAELEQMKVSDEYFDAKFKVLAENVRHHIKEEEREMMPQARKADVDFDALGQELLARKKQLMKQGVPPSAEEKLIMRNGGAADSPARTAKGKSASSAGAKNQMKGSYTSSSRPSGKTKEAARSNPNNPKAARGRRS